MIDRRTARRLLLNRPQTQPDKWAGTIESVAPLRVRVRTAVVDSTPDTLVPDLTVGDAVWGETVAGRSVILGRFGSARLITASGAELITPAAGVTVVSCEVARVGRVGQIALRVQLGTDLTGGDHPNLSVGTLTAGWRPAIRSPLVTAAAGSSVGALASNGAIEVVASMVAVTAGTSLDLCGTYLLGDE